jgi:transcriptional regulator with XRE-family HTH domain
MGDFGGRIVELRNRKNMSTKEVARAVGIPQSRYSELERGVRVPGDAQVERLEKFFGLNHGELAAPAANDIETTGRSAWN